MSDLLSGVRAAAAAKRTADEREAERTRKVEREGPAGRLAAEREKAARRLRAGVERASRMAKSMDSEDADNHRELGVKALIAIANLIRVLALQGDFSFRQFGPELFGPDVDPLRRRKHIRSMVGRALRSVHGEWADRLDLATNDASVVETYLGLAGDLSPVYAARSARYAKRRDLRDALRAVKSESSVSPDAGALRLDLALSGRDPFSALEVDEPEVQE